VREDCEHCPPSSKKEESPPRPPSDECDLQHTVGGGEAPESAGLSEAIYVIHRSWWPGLSDPEADHLLDGHLKDLAGSNSKCRLEQIILTLKDEHASGRVDQPGKLVGHRVARADKRSSAARSATHTDTAGETAAFKAWQVLGRVGFGDKVTGADAMDILAAVPGSDPDTVRRHIREVCGKWTGQNKSAQHVVAEVTRQLRPPDATSQAEQAAETVRIEKPTKSAQEDAAAFAALRKQMPSARSPTGA
jgi:hypothetical protein